ncbi:peritrophin-48 [Mycetomoellerius zeteki]|uniref:peritrophin-48 n=1 Tax=Mycetomoellerius zeteki TaxID=64791 RepID=UPI00084E77B6|nr:PREDICTED: peritrophin-48-like [Trachymyrmex zeteki]
MKGIYLIAIAFLASWTVITASKLPIIFETEDECPVLDIFPPKVISHKTDCTKYYECKNNQKQLRFCEVGLYFSKRWGGCVTQEISDCSQDESDDQCPNPDPCPPKLIPIKEDCTKYYECKNSKKEPRSCKVGLYFSQRWHGCVDREISDCPLTTPTPTSTTPTPTSTTPIPTSTTPTPTSTTPTPTSTTPTPISTTPTPTTPPLLECPNPDTCPPKLISHETDCTKYYECKNSKKEPRSCKAGLYFSQRWHGCVELEISDCPLTTPTSTPTATTPTSTSTTPILLECPNPDSCPPKLISHETDCTKYYECKNSKKEPRSCKAGLYFSQRWHGCVELNISDCLPKECPNPDTCPPKLISYETDCTKYYECKNSKKEPRSCKAGLYFSQRWHGCVELNISDCSLPISPSISTATLTSTIPTAHYCTDGDLLKHECTCTKYYLCIEGYKALFECPAGKHFDISTKTCQPGTSCLQVTPSSISSPTSIPITSQCTENEYMPHECECNKYYECKVGRKALRECNDGMIFDKALQTCVLGQC